MAVALKQAYPRPETGAEDPATGLPSPPVFVPVENQSQKLAGLGYGAAFGFIAGFGVAYLAWKSNR